MTDPWGASFGVCMQADYLRQLNQSGQSEAVINLFESNRLAFSQETLGEYIKALARVDKLDNSRVMNLMQVCASSLPTHQLGTAACCIDRTGQEKLSKVTTADVFTDTMQF